MKKILLILGLFGSFVQASNPIISYVQISTGGTQAGGPNTQTATVKNSLALPFIGAGTQCVRSVNGAISGTGVDCGAGAVVGGSNTIVASPQYQIPFYSAAGSTNVLTGASGFSWYGSSATLPTLTATSGLISPQFSILSSTTGGVIESINGGIGIASNQDIYLNPQSGNSVVMAMGAKLAFVPSNGSARTSLIASTSPVSILTFTLPPSSGTAGQFLSTDGNGTMSWATASGGGGGGGLGGTIVASPQFQVPYYSVAGTTTTVSGASGLTVNGAGNTLTASGGLATNTLTATGASSFTGAVSINPNATISGGTGNQLILNQTTIGVVQEGINFQELGASEGNYHQRNYSGLCSDLTTSCLTTPQAFDAGSGDLFFMNRDGRFDAMPTGSKFNAYSSVIGGSLIVGGTSGFSYTDIQQIGDGNLLVNHGVIASTLTLNGSGNPSFTKGGSTDTYQIVGSSSVPTPGHLAVWSSSMAIVDGGIAPVTSNFISNQSTYQEATMNIASATINGTFSIFSSSVPTSRYGAIENPLQWISLQSSIGNYPGAQTSGLYVDVLDTGTHTNPLNDMIAIHGLARQFSSSDSQLIGGWFDAYGQGPGSPNIAAIYAVPAWASDLATGTTSTMIGINITPRVTSLNGLVNKSTGTVIGLQIPDYTSGTGASGQNWAFYIPNPYPSYFNGTIGLGQTDPQAKLSIAVPNTTAFALIIGTNTAGSSATMGTGQYNMTVSSGGNITADKATFGKNTSGNGYVNISSAVSNSNGLLALRSGANFDAVTIGRTSNDYTFGVANGNNFLSDNVAGDVFARVEGATNNYRIGFNSGASAFNMNISSITYNGNMFLTNSQGLLGISNGQTGSNIASGMNLQSTPVSPTGFAGGLLGFNLSYNVGVSSYLVSNDFGTDYFGMMVERNGDVAFSGSGSVASNTFLTHAQVMANNKLYIKGTTGLLGVNMGATTPSTAEFQVQGSTTVPYLAYLSTTTTGGFGVDVSTTGHFNIFNSSATQGPTITNGTGDASCSDVACTITASNSPVTFTFAKPYTKVPVCVVTEQTDSLVNALSYSKTATALTITQTGLSGALLDVICVGRD